MTLETKLNHEPLLTYLRTYFSAVEPAPSNPKAYIFQKPALINVQEKGAIKLWIGNDNQFFQPVLHFSKKAQLGWYFVKPEWKHAEEGDPYLRLSILKVGSAESYEFAGDWAVKRDEFERAQQFRDASLHSLPFDSKKLLQKPASKKPLWIAAGVLALAASAFGTKTYIDTTIQRAEKERAYISQRQDIWKHANNLLQQDLNTLKFAEVYPEAMYLGVASYSAASPSVPETYNFIIAFHGLDGRTLTLCMNAKTGEWWNKNKESEQIVKDYGLESTILRLQQRIESSR